MQSNFLPKGCPLFLRVSFCIFFTFSFRYFIIMSMIYFSDIFSKNSLSYFICIWILMNAHKKESMPFSHEFLILLFLKNPDILFLLVRRVHIINTCHIVHVSHISHINHAVCTGHIVHCLSCRHQPAELLKQIQKNTAEIPLAAFFVYFFLYTFFIHPTVLHYALCVSVYIHIFLDFCINLYTHFCSILYRSFWCL